MSNYKVDTVVIGAGAVGLAVAENLSKSGREVLVLESEDDFGKITSSRNSGVIHAGIYYPDNSLKSKFCVEGNKLLYNYCKKNHVPYENTEKLINRPIGFSHLGFYVVQIEEGIRAAGTVEIAGLNKKPNQKRLSMIEREARKLLPALGKIKSTWLGFRPTLPDAMPIIGQSEKNKKVFYAFGHQHIGWTLGAVTGKVIKELVQGRKTNIYISAISQKRFS